VSNANEKSTGSIKISTDHHTDEFSKVIKNSGTQGVSITKDK